MSGGTTGMPARAPAGRKRFWKQAQLVPQDGAFAVELDGRCVRLPGKTALCVPSRALAEALVAEWQAAGQGAEGYFTPEDLPLTGIAGSMLERIPQARDGVLESLLLTPIAIWSATVMVRRANWQPNRQHCGTRGWHGLAKPMVLPSTQHMGLCPSASPGRICRRLARLCRA
nr:ATP12 family chaperone protein [Acetobacter okinawensis]